MNRDEILKMAQEADAEITNYINYVFDENVVLFGVDQLERFAALVAEPLQARIKDLYRQLDEAEKQLDEQYKMDMEAEREACAKLCESRFMGDLNREDMEARRLAAAIRARGEK